MPNLVHLDRAQSRQKLDAAICAVAWPIAMVSALVAARDYLLPVTVSLLSSLAFASAARGLWKQHAARPVLILFALPLSVLFIHTLGRLLFMFAGQ